MINYQLRCKDTIKDQSVFAYLTGYFKESDGRLKISLGKKINPTEFGDLGENFKYNRDKINKSKKPSTLVFKRCLEDFESAVSKVQTYFLGVSLDPTLEQFKEQLLLNLGRTTKQKTIEENIILVTDFVEAYCDECRILVAKGSKKMSETSLRKYIQITTHIKNYQEHTKKPLYIHNVSYDVFTDIVDVVNKIAIGAIKLKTNHQRSKSAILNKKGYTINTLNTFTSRFKFMLKQARIRGYNLHPTMHLDDTRLVIGASKGAKDFYFDNEFLLRIYNHQPQSKSTQLAKDYILLASTTGMRYQSVAMLYDQKPQQVVTSSGESFMVIINFAKKTGIKLLSPLMKPAQEIYDRLGYFPSFPSVVSITRQIRALLKEMKVTDKVTLTRTLYGAGQVVEYRQMVDVASSHICRTSFITNLLNLRVDRNKVQAMTHKAMNDGSAFSVYDKRSEIDRAIEFYEVTKDLNSEFFAYKKGLK